MAKVPDKYRVRVNAWVHVRLRTGQEVIGQVVCHHDHHPRRHTIRLPDHSMKVVDFPTDKLLKISSKPMAKMQPAPVAAPAPVKLAKAAPEIQVVTKEVFVDREVKVPVKIVSRVELGLAFLIGLALGGIGVAGYLANFP